MDALPSDDTPEVPGAADTPAVASAEQLANENALLRASLAEMRAWVSELEELADSDTVTPLPNRRRFMHDLERVVGQAGRHGTPAALLYIDVNGLKGINDTHGRLAGDAALIHVAKLLSRLIRSTDVLARIGGDEFGLILDHLDHNSAIETAGRLARCIADNPLDIGGTLVRIDAAIGVATILPGDSPDDIVRRADLNLYRAKEES
ncbi:MAG: GGDEF domain-containing protein [Sphingomonadales bacterium]